MNFPTVAAMRFMIALIAVLLTVWSEWFPAPMHSYFADEWLRDHFVRSQASAVPESRIAIIDIDEASLATVGPWPWPRNRIADLLEKLIGEYGARGVALDLVFPERADAEGDMRLAMLAQHGPVVLAQAFDYVQRSSAVRVGQIAGGTTAIAEGKMAVATGFIGNHAGLAEARHVGNIGFIPDDDGTIRRLPMMTLFDGRAYPTLSKALLDCCGNPDEIRMPEAVGDFRRVPFPRDWSAYTVVPAINILNGSAPVTAINGRLVIVGSSSLGLTDRVATPLSASTAGMLVHAAALSAFLDVSAGHAPAVWPGQWLATGFVILVALLAAYTFPRLSAVANVGLLMTASIAWLGLAYWIAPHDARFATSGPLVSNLFLLAVAVPLDWQLAQRKSRQLLGTLRQYVAKAVVDELLRRDLKDPLTPQRLNVTTLIADMQGYTGQVESLSMEEAAQLTRDFLACLTRPVLDKHGTLDKFTGDGLVAFWGAPLPVDDHADLALDAAQEIVQEVQRFSAIREQEGKPPLRVRIGIESGIAMAGDFGTTSRSIYTAVGDSVNVASRLEQLAREFPHDIIVGQGTVSRAKRHRFKFLGEKLLRGKEHPTMLYTVELVA
ncbi:adenylate/guanylate cyclase domain-containing protein [Herbaspirillum sp. ST 5-3]|uniref:CHASE2 domain-containing protein n=1 Tax=Oxalobacteraceae TaxID=75682 RepID=UPI0010A3B3BC|nr:adenylate/guanylate cyclase domain-containing protein [Herbaspirillum sp. ST 5-3]